MPVTTGVGSPLKGIAGGRGREIRLEDVARKVSSASRVFRSPDSRSLQTAGEIIATNIEIEARRRGVTRFAGKPWRGYMVRPTRVRSDPYVIIRPRQLGATVILDSGASPHIIGAKGLGTRRAWKNNPTATARRRYAGGPQRRSGALAVWWSGLGRPVAYVRHPGAPGKNFVDPGFRRGERVALDAWNAITFSNFAKFFD